MTEDKMPDDKPITTDIHLAALDRLRAERDAALAEVERLKARMHLTGVIRPYAVVVVIEHRGCLILPAYPKAPAHPVLPGGKVEAGEDPHHAALREVREETGLPFVEIEETPFFIGESHNGKPLWAYRGHVSGIRLADEWEGPEGRVHLVPVSEAEKSYYPPFLPAFRRVMAAWSTTP